MLEITFQGTMERENKISPLSQTIHAIFPIAFLFSKELHALEDFLLEKKQKSNSRPVLKEILSNALENCLAHIFIIIIHSL